MLKTPLISFVVTSYNYENFIIKTLESIRNQTYKNYEIIVVDDCSMDSSVEKVENFINVNQDIRITLIKHDVNRGQFAAMMTGLKAANGVFVSFVDSDDVLVEEYAAAHLKVHMAISVAFTSCALIEIDENDEVHTVNSIASPESGHELEAKMLEEFLSIDIEHVPFKKLQKKRFGGWYWSPNSSAVFRKSAIEVMLKYSSPEKWKICPDKFLFNIANLIGGSVIIDLPLVGYRRHKKNAGCSNYVTGDSKYPSDKTTLVNVNNNIKIRPETLKFLLENKSYFIEKFGTRGFVKFVFSVIF